MHECYEERFASFDALEPATLVTSSKGFLLWGMPICITITLITLVVNTSLKHISKEGREGAVAEQDNLVNLKRYGGKGARIGRPVGIGRPKRRAS